MPLCRPLTFKLMKNDGGSFSRLLGHAIIQSIESGNRTVNDPSFRIPSEASILGLSQRT